MFSFYSPFSGDAEKKQWIGNKKGLRLDSKNVKYFAEMSLKMKNKVTIVTVFKY